MRRLASTGRSARSKPPTLTRPAVGGRKPVIIFMVVDLPAPLGPRKPSTVPRSTEKLTPSTAVKAPKRFTRWSISIIAMTGLSLGCGARRPARSSKAPASGQPGEEPGGSHTVEPMIRLSGQIIRATGRAAAQRARWTSRELAGVSPARGRTGSRGWWCGGGWRGRRRRHRRLPSPPGPRRVPPHGAGGRRRPG